ncbi:MAG: hypothetical protein ACTTKP_04460 [Catonella sp.]|uniref:hypothetical protein n=1 Tax=Catonella sp. TaxID=2382125 RepID=UPI003FA05331
MGRKSQHNISRANIWENTFSNILTKDTNPTIKELLYAVLAQETFGSEYIDDIFSKWDKTYSDIFNILKELETKLASKSAFKLQNIDLKQPYTIEDEKFVKTWNNVKYSLERLPKHFQSLNDNTITIKFEDNFKFLEKSVGFSVRQEQNIKNFFQEDIIGNPLTYTLKDNLSPRVSDDVVLCNLALILAFAHNKSIPFNILNEELSEQLDNILIKNNTDLSTEGNKKINTDNFNLALDFLKKHITSYIPFSNEIKYQIIFTSYINATYKRIHKPLNECIKTLENIVTFLKNNINYTQNTKLLKEISTLFFDQEIEYKSLKTLCEKWTSYLNNLENCKKQVLVEYHSLLPKIAFEVLQSELQIIDNEISEIAHSVYNNLQCTNSDINKYYAFVSNIRTSNNFDHLWYIIESLVKMPDSISNNFIDIFMSKFNNEKTQSHVNINISLDDLKDLVNTIHLSGEHLEKLATIRFDELTDKKWNFLYCLPIIENENKEWFEDFFSMLKIYCK